MLGSPKATSPPSSGSGRSRTPANTTDGMFHPSLEIDLDNVTYSVNDPTLPWRILEYFSSLQIEVSYVANIEKRKLYSEYLFKKMNVYLYSVGGTGTTVKLKSPGALSPEFFVDMVNHLSTFLVLMMTAMLFWYVGYLGYWCFRSQSELARTSWSDVVVESSPRLRRSARLREIGWLGT
ncbi:hypothetical protein HPB47_023251 [Ixodes persulcatus]|uniref:Uncharacterized protein n=1 Tax=Ixodes persulcatus TaxID=34615 RepID=A0AC60Q9W2_IXOPE|nr:hypothetical protein HPB47_023251 [Ixodes persulcatus]